MSINAGFTAEQIREVVHEYTAQPFGHKAEWLSPRRVSYNQLRKWRLAVFDGDLNRGLIPRDSGGVVKIPPGQRAALERHPAKERTEREAEVERLNARIRELEETNGALGRAIELLHSMSEQEPAVPPTTGDRSDS